MQNAKKGKRNVWIALMAAATMMLAASNMTGNVVRAEEVSENYGTLINGASGNCGAEGNEDKVTWALYDSDDDDDEGDTLVISGTGDMADYVMKPWSDYQLKLKEVIVKKGVTRIGDYAFAECSSLSSITIPEGVTSIGDYAFSNCHVLSSMTIPEGVTSIGKGAFFYCNNLSCIEISSSVASIGVQAFSECSKLSQITVNEQNQYFSSANGVLFNKDRTELVCCPTATGEYRIPEGVTKIGDYAFYFCSSLSSIMIPEGVESIGERAFAYCSGLNSITIPEGVESIGVAAFHSCSGLSSITISEGVRRIGNYAFISCSGLSNIYIKGTDSMEENQTIEVDAYAFNGVASDATVYLESSSLNLQLDTYAGLTANQIKQPYTISYTPEDGSKTTIAKVYADGNQSYTFQQDDLPESVEASGEWQYKDGKENKDVMVAAGSTIDSISQNIELVIVPFASYSVDNNTKTLEQVTTLPQGWKWSENDKEKTLPAGQSIEVTAEYTGMYEELYVEKSRIVSIMRASCKEDPKVLYTGANEKKPTCTEDGNGHTECSLCHDVISANTIVPATGHMHKEVIDIKEATCKEEGYTGTTYCTDCETPLVSGNSIPKSTTHTWDAGVVTKEATATEKGVKTFTCSVCETTTTEEIQALGTSEGSKNPGNGTSGSENSGSEKPGSETPGNENSGNEEAVSGYPTVEATEKKITSTNTDKGDIEGSTFVNLQLKATGKKKSIKLKWKKVKGADGYIVYGSRCGQKLKKLTTLEGVGKLTYTQKKLKAGKYYKYMVVAYKNVGGKQYIIATSKSVHAVTDGSKYANPTKISVKKVEMTIKKGKKQTIKASLVIPGSKKSKTCIAKFRYESNNEKVATVNKKGVVTAKKKGTTYIYVYGQNGVYKKVKITVQ